ncbi:MAG: 50S ribosomal protein L15 [bacterium]|nr:50S ribosomal protein L15 [bacterium]
MRLNNLERTIGSRHPDKRVGRGPGSGHGKTSCRGHKGGLARSGGKRTPGFEGGQMPLIRRTPKRGFRNVFQRFEYTIVNLDVLNRLVEDSKIDIRVLKVRGIIKQRVNRLKILGTGEVTRKITVIADAFSASAIKKIQSAGGEVVLCGNPKSK